MKYLSLFKGRLVLTAILILAVVLPLIIKDAYSRHLLVLFLIFSLLSLSLDIIIGYLGEVTFGQAAFFGVGSYTSALLSMESGVPVFLSILLAGIAASMIGFFVGYVSLRIKGPYFAIFTLCIGMILFTGVLNWVELTRGPMGIPEIPPPTIKLPYLKAFSFTTEISFYYLTLLLTLIFIYVIHSLFRSATGRAIIALRENENLATSIGINPFTFKVIAVCFSTFLAGIAGALYAHYIKFISPDILGFHYMTVILTMVIIGGKGMIVGPIVGALLMTILPEYLRMATTLRELIFGFFLIICIIFIPEGICRILKTRFRELRMKITEEGEKQFEGKV